MESNRRAAEIKAERMQYAMDRAQMVDPDAVMETDTDGSYTITYRGYIDFFEADGRLMAHLEA